MIAKPRRDWNTCGLLLRIAPLGGMLLLLGCWSDAPPPPVKPPGEELAGEAATSELTAAPTSAALLRDVEPIFAEHCYECHGPDEEEGGLRLDEPARRLAGGKSGSAVIVPGNRASSLLYQYITGQNEDHMIMPPKDHAPSLSPEECEKVGQWIEALEKRD